MTICAVGKTMTLLMPEASLLHSAKQNHHGLWILYLVCLEIVAKVEHG